MRPFDLLSEDAALYCGALLPDMQQHAAAANSLGYGFQKSAIQLPDRQPNKDTTMATICIPTGAMGTHKQPWQSNSKAGSQAAAAATAAGALA
jgi:hypothetical protein